MNRRLGFAALLAVIGVSIVFGMIVGGRLNAPEVMQAARDATPLFAQAPAIPAGAAAPSFADIADEANPAVVSVTNTSVRKAQSDDMHEQFRNDPFFRWFFGPQGQGPRGEEQPQRVVSGGSGFIISPEGYILTNNHVVEGTTRLTVGLSGGEKMDAEVIGTDPAIDLALIKINPAGKRLPVLPLGDSDKLRVGEWVIAIGNPLDLEHTVTVGVVSAKGRDIGMADFQLARLIQTDAAINFGNSGGPLLDSQGRVVGINTAIIRGGGGLSSPVVQGIGFAVPINEAKRAAEQLRATGSVQRGYLGISMVPAGITDAARESLHLPDTNGVIVESVVPDGPAGKAGLREDDVIRKVDGQAVKDNNDLLGAVASRKPGEKVDLDILRGGKTVHATVALGVRPLRGGQQPDSTEGQEDAPGEAEGLGIKVEALTQRSREEIAQRMGVEPDELKGVVVTDVDIDSPAADEGLQPGVVVTGVNNRAVSGISDWNDAMSALKPGDAVKLKVRMGQVTRSVFLRVPPKKGS
jgi:serine protease Do